tara:strand:- start:656 stop:1087 length:432 start_codon:yes stop_codon:yes gene_type:complete
MKYEIKEVATSSVKVEYEDGSWANVPINGTMTKNHIVATIDSYATKPGFSKTSDIPVSVGDAGESTDLEKAPEEKAITYGVARSRQYPERGDQWDALYWQRKGDDSYITKIDEAIADTKAKWPKDMAAMTETEYNAKVKELYG